MYYDTTFYRVMTEGMANEGFAPSVPTLESLKMEALSWTNRKRQDRGLPKLKEFGSALQRSSMCCVLAQATGGIFGGDGTARLMHLNDDGWDFQDETLPASVALFEIFFEAGFYPDLVAGRFPDNLVPALERIVQLRHQYKTPAQVEADRKLHAELSEQFEEAADQQELLVR